MSTTTEQSDAYWTALYAIRDAAWQVEKEAGRVAAAAADITMLASQAQRHVEKHRPGQAEWDRLTDIDALTADLDNLKRSLQLLAAQHTDHIGTLLAGDGD